MFVLLGNRPVPVAELFVLVEPNKWLNKQTNHYMLLLIKEDVAQEEARVDW